MLSYATYKSIHLLGVVLFLGNIIVTGVWKVMADRTANPFIVGFAQRLVTLTDWIFTTSGVVILLIGGYGMAHVGGLDTQKTSWLIIAQSLFIASGIIWLFIVIPLQIWQARIARTFENGGTIPPLYWRLNHHWLIWGLIATVLPLANLYVMVAKP